MTRGIYLLADDRVVDHAIALAASLRARDAETPVVLIPYTERYAAVAEILARHFDVRLYEDLELVERIPRMARRAFGEGFLRRPDNLRKQACWFGPFDEFLYLDADIVVFERIVRLLDHLAEHDFVCCDDQHEGGLRHVFSERIVHEAVFTPEQLGHVFNGGLWGSRRGLISEDDLYATFEECAERRACLDFAHGGTDQPILNYLVLSRLRRRHNLFRRPGPEPRMWAGTRGFKRRGDLLIDPAVGRPLRFLHWAGTWIGPGGPYWDTWKRYRFLDPGVPRQLSPAVLTRPPRPGPVRRVWRRAVGRVRRGLAAIR